MTESTSRAESITVVEGRGVRHMGPKLTQYGTQSTKNGGHVSSTANTQSSPSLVPTNANPSTDSSLPFSHELFHLGNHSSPLVFRGKVGRCHSRFLIDSGASTSFISSNFVSQNRLKTSPISDGPIIVLADGTTYKCTEILSVASVRVGPYQETIKPLFVLPLSLRFDVILGKTWLEQHNPDIDWQVNRLSFVHEGHTVVLQADVDYTVPPEGLLTAAQMACLYESGEAIHLAVLTAPSVQDLQISSPPVPVNVQDAAHLSEYQPQLDQLLREFSDVLPETLPEHLPPDRSGHVHRIELEPGHSPPSKPTYRLSYEEQRELKIQLLDLLEKGFIQPSKSPFGAPILFVKKKDGKLRMCIDYRALNQITIKNRCPLPRIDDLLDRLQGAKYFTCLDLRSGYHQVLVHPDDVEKTAFRTRYGHFEFKVLPFGLCNAPATFQTLMNDVFREEVDDFVLVYLDDIMIFSKTPQDHLDHVRRVLQKLHDNQLYAAPNKCRFLQTTVEWLGHVVSNHGISVDPRKTSAIMDWPTLKTSLQIMSFLGLAGYYRRFIPDFSKIAAPLTNLLRKNEPFVWGSVQETAFTTLKTLLSSTPVLILASPDFPFSLYTDASGGAIGGVLMQDQGTGLRPVAYFSRKLAKAELNYAVTEQELLSLIYGLQTYRHYLLGAPRSTAYTDHHALKFLQTQPQLSRRQTRWNLVLQEFDLHVDYVPGKSNVVADALSRRPDDAPFDTLASIMTTRTDPDWLTVIKVAYGNDPESKNILSSIHDSSSKVYQIENGLITHLHRGVKRLYIPDSATLRQDLLFEHHDSCFGGHLGMDKTLDYISRNYFWPTMISDVREYVRTCPECITSKSANRKPAGLLQPLPIPTRKFECVTMDFVSHLGLTSQGNNTVLIFVCKLTKALRLAATNLGVTPDLERSTLSCYTGGICTFGRPHLLRSSRPIPRHPLDNHLRPGPPFYFGILAYPPFPHGYQATSLHRVPPSDRRPE